MKKEYTKWKMRTACPKCLDNVYEVYVGLCPQCGERTENCAACIKVTPPKWFWQKEKIEALKFKFVGYNTSTTHTNTEYLIPKYEKI